MIRVNFKKIVPEATEPKRVHNNDAGFDMTCVSIKETDKYVEYGTGIALEIPDGYAGFLYPRSSVTKKDLMLKNSVGIIDAGYRGEISFRFYKNIVKDTKIPLNVKGSILGYIFPSERDQYNIGEKIGQLIIQKIPEVTFIQVNEISDSERGTGGYGSTDNK